MQSDTCACPSPMPIAVSSGGAPPHEPGHQCHRAVPAAGDRRDLPFPRHHLDVVVRADRHRHAVQLAGASAVEAGGAGGRGARTGIHGLQGAAPAVGRRREGPEGVRGAARRPGWRATVRVGGRRDRLRGRLCHQEREFLIHRSNCYAGTCVKDPCRRFSCICAGRALIAQGLLVTSA